jgi:RNA polymerase sigma factor for flagellar operon FliA
MPFGDQWRAWRYDASEPARRLLIESYLPFARMLAAKAFARRTYAELEFGDYFHYALLGLIESVDRFDPERGFKFETFAASRIIGAILNGVSSLSEKQEQVNFRKRLLTERTQALAAAPAEQGIDTLFTYLADVALGLAIGFALEGSGMVAGEEERADGAATPYERVEMAHLQRRARALMEQLPPNESKVLRYHYLQQLSLGEIGQMLGLTKGRISQIHTAGLARLRRELEKEGHDCLAY